MGATEKAAPIPALLPCPFCDNDGRLKEGHRDHWIVECVHCVATTGYYEARDGGKERAAAAWNRRAAQASREERIREDERDRIYERAERHAAGKMPDANAAAAWLTREEDVMLPADRARHRGDAA